MIALKQEQREELIAYAKAAIKECDMHGEDYTPRPEMMVAALKVALAALTVEPSGYRWFHEGSSETRGWYADCFPLDSDYLEKCLADKSIHSYESLFTAPPIPEIKGHQIREMVSEITDTATKYQGCQCLRDAISKVVIKRLNGLGE